MNDFCRPPDCSCRPGSRGEVKECVGNDKACHCTAECITVAKDSTDAACDTYRKG